MVLIDKNYMKGCTERDVLVKLCCEMAVLVDWSGTTLSWQGSIGMTVLVWCAPADRPQGLS